MPFGMANCAVRRLPAECQSLSLGYAKRASTFRAEIQAPLAKIAFQLLIPYARELFFAVRAERTDFLVFFEYYHNTNPPIFTGSTIKGMLFFSYEY